jgi:hypothetical protein
MARIVVDAFYHAPPETTIGSLIAGAFAQNTGRYMPHDLAHPNGLSHLAAALAADGHELRLLTEPYTDASLADADIVLSANPDYPVYPSSSPHRWTPAAVDSLERFVRRGGGLLLLVNSFLSRPDVWEENFDLERVSLLFDRVGLHWDANYMSSADIIEPATGLGRTIGYGQGGRVRGDLPAGMEPVLTYQGMTYGVRTKLDAGSIVVLGDAGLASNGLVSFPGYENLTFVLELVEAMRPAWERGWQGPWTTTRSGSVSMAPARSVEPLFRALRPAATWSETFHYRHLTWDARETVPTLETVLADAPVRLDLIHAGSFTAEVALQRLDSDVPGPKHPIAFAGRRVLNGDVTDVHVLGRADLTGAVWADVCGQSGWIGRGTNLERISVVVDQRVTFVAGELRSARWQSGQLIYARTTEAAHYGYEIVVSSERFVVAPTTVVPTSSRTPVA